MEVAEKGFAVGDWVMFSSGRLKGYSGFILKQDESNETCRIKITYDSNGKKISGATWCESHELEMWEIQNDEDDLLALIDVALETNDKDWFLELTSKLP